MDFFEVIEKRRSIRRFTETVFPDDKIKQAIDAAILAPNSSNTQTWDFFWIKTPAIRDKVVEACLSQSAARTATQLVVFTSNRKHWKRSQRPLMKYLESVNAPKQVQDYYKKLIPLTYRAGLFSVFAPLKWILANGIGLFRPMLRGPYSNRDIQEVATKSSALAAENFVLAITALGGASCMMEGFDESRLKAILKLSSSTKITMVIGIGYEAELGTWGPRFRIPTEDVLHIV
ncbi:MAG: nitroreductase family protein [Pseudobdellovibrionaceae bacterium]